ncbi:MAG TPA: hypothetical protein PKC43_06035 [Phycisphaerales bacterium]|nr:hypothetical protein [Phycisphaerales bacterium]HMP36992.1 hypothetical protein [Phycisphaerales bacterium]
MPALPASARALDGGFSRGSCRSFSRGFARSWGAVADGAIVGVVVAVIAGAVAPTCSLRAAAAPLAADEGRPADSSAVVTVHVFPGRTLVRPGEVIPVAVVLDHSPGWSTAAPRPRSGSDEAPSLPLLATVRNGDPRAMVRRDAVQWPDVETARNEHGGLSGRVIGFVPVEIAPDAKAGNVEVVFVLTLQAFGDGDALPAATVERAVLLAIDPPPVIGGGGYRMTAEPSSPPPPEPLESPALFPDLFRGWRPVAPVEPGLIATGAGGGTFALVILAGTVVAAIVIGVVTLGVLRQRRGQAHSP